jgi:uncharacterized protein (TIGR02118 family)
MAYRSVSFWSEPLAKDLEDFEDYYMNVHVPFAARVPGAIKLILTRTSDGFETTPPAFYRVAEMWFDDKAAFERAVTTAEWADMRADGNYVHERFGVALESALGFVGDVVLHPSGPKPLNGGASNE